MRTGSGSFPLPNLLGRRIIRGRLKPAVDSGGVDECFAMGDGDSGPPFDIGDCGRESLVELEGESGVGGASEPRRDLDLTLSKSTFRKGSGS